MPDEHAPVPLGPDQLTDDAIRERIIRLAFGGDRTRYQQFLDTLRETIPPDVSIVLRGSAVTGTRWTDGQPFDGDGPGTSDLDLTLVGRDLLQHWKTHYIPGLHSEPLSDEHPDVSPMFVPLRNVLCRIAGRPVNIQATTSFIQFARDVLLGQPYFVVIDKEEREPEGEGEVVEEPRAT